MSFEQLSELVGRPLPGAELVLEDYEHWLGCDAILAPPLPGGVAHPMFAYYLALRGMGLTLDEMFALMGADASAGVMFGEARLEWHEELKVGGRYRVDGEIVDVVRKSGRRSGTFDVLTFRLEVRATGSSVAWSTGSSVATSTNSFVFPRSAP